MGQKYELIGREEWAEGRGLYYVKASKATKKTASQSVQSVPHHHSPFHPIPDKIPGYFDNIVM
jgi:hypothetical protein